MMVGFSTILAFFSPTVRHKSECEKRKRKKQIEDNGPTRHNSTNDPGGEAIFLENVVAEGPGTVLGEGDKETTRGLGGEAIQEFEVHLCVDGVGLGDEGQRVDLKVDRLALIPAEILGMPKEAKTCHIGGGVGAVTVHQAGANSIEAGHGNAGGEVGVPGVLLGHDPPHPLPLGRDVKPLVGVNRDLGSQGLGEDEDVARDGGGGQDDLRVANQGGGNTPNDEPRVDDGLAAGDEAASLLGKLGEAGNHEGANRTALGRGECAGEGQQHEHVVAVGDPHGIEVREDIGAGDAALGVRVIDVGVEEVGGLDELEVWELCGHDRGVHPNVAVADPLEQAEQFLLGDLAASSFELPDIHQVEIRLQTVVLWVEILRKKTKNEVKFRHGAHNGVHHHHPPNSG